MTKPDPSRNAPSEVDAYLAAQPDDVRAELERLRGIIHELAPEVTERVSYRIPIFRLKRDLIAFSAHTNHCALHVMSQSLLDALADDLRGVKISGLTLHFTPDKPLPWDLVEKIVRRRAQEIGA